MRFAFEEREKDLAHDGGIGVVHLLEEDVAAHGFVGLFGEQFFGEHHFPEG